MCDSRWYQSNKDLHADLNLQTIEEVIGEFARSHEGRLRQHINVEAIRLLDTEQDMRRLKRNKP